MQRRFRELIYRETGIKMPQNKDHLIASRLRKRQIALGLNSLDSYLAHLFDGGALDAEWPEILDLVTTNKTDFFREPAHYDVLAHTAIPEAFARKSGTEPVQFRLWSAAASIGAEAYSAAMVLAEAARENRLLDWMILGTDLSGGALAKARNAIYPAEELAPVPPELRQRYAMRGRPGARSREMRIVPELRRRTRFEQLNLIEPPYPVAFNLDVIMLRNVLIYFDHDRQTKVVNNVVDHLRPGGHFYVGHAESMIVNDPRLEQLAPATFRRKDTI